MDTNNSVDTGRKKMDQLSPYLENDMGQKATTDNGLKISNTDDSLKLGERGPTLLEDFHFRQKITHFDHERIPERVVHARGFGAHGFFQLYESMSEYTKAKFLQDPNLTTPVFVRFSTVVGSRGSADTVRDVRGFATKFYTEDGNLDIVGNNIPVFFIQDAIKFPDIVHAIKPEPHNEVPQATSAHDTFWDFVVNTPETAHMVMWLMSDRAIPRSFRMMEGFGVNTFRLINAQGQARFVKFHWKPLLGVHSLLRDEAQRLSGKDPDFHRRDLWDAIEQGNYPEYELGVQIIEESQEFSFDFDILDPTKVWPEELIPVKIIGKMTLNKNVDNFFAETEQVAFCPANIVPGIDFSNDPLLQGRLFSYEDTQLSRLGGPNFRQIPINRPVVPVHNDQRDGGHQMRIHQGNVSYFPNMLAQNSPSPADEAEGGFVHYAERVDAHKVRARSQSFRDHFRQATLFWNSMSPTEKAHIVDAFHYEAGSVKNKEVKQAVADMFAHVAPELGEQIAVGIGVNRPPSVPANDMKASSAALSQENTIKSARTRKVAVLVENGFCPLAVNTMLNELKAAGAVAETVSSSLAPITGKDGTMLEPNKSFVTTSSLVYDAVFIPGGANHADAISQNIDVRLFINEALRHMKTVGAADEAAELLLMTDAAGLISNFTGSEGTPWVNQGVVLIQGADNLQPYCAEFINQLSGHRHWGRLIDYPITAAAEPLNPGVFSKPPDNMQEDQGRMH
ncbi:catalase [Desulfosporosinus youngiae]|uniref:Catalase n=1 Tax=Desulfosporosinus youngiae DSM 17734 TaxID=768710 RepID=H5XTM9_9FIRM|nr:catalase [Desulfosporosinus youngiae DSM 17734]